MTQSSRRSAFKVLVAERLEQRFVFDGSESLVEWGTDNDMFSHQADTALFSKIDSVQAHKTMPIWASDEHGASSEFQIELDGFPVAQELRDNRLFVVVNRTDGTGIIEEFDVSNMLSPQRISSLEVPSIINAADFFDDTLVLRTMEQADLPAVAPMLTVMGGMESTELSELGESTMPWSDDVSAVFPPTTIQVLELSRLSEGVIASQKFRVPIDRVFVLGDDLFVVTSNTFAAPSIAVGDEIEGFDSDPSPQLLFAPPPQTFVERFHLDTLSGDSQSGETQSGKLRFEDAFSFDGMIMEADMWRSDATEGLALLMQSFHDLPYSSTGKFAIQAFRMNGDGEVDYTRIPVTLPSGDNWVSSFDFNDARAILGSPQGLTMINATELSPIVSTSLTYENQFSTWAQLDGQSYLRITNAIDSEDGSITGHNVTLDLLDVSDFSHPKTIASRTFGESDKPEMDWTWSVMENHVLKQAEGRYLLLIPTSSMPAEPLSFGPDGEGDLIPPEPIILPRSLDSNLQLISISVSQESAAEMNLMGEFSITGPITDLHLNGDVLTTMGYGEVVVVNLSEKPLAPVRIALQDPLWTMEEPPLDVNVDLIANTIVRNLANPTDANSDGATNQLDVLLLTNELNSRGSYALLSSSEIKGSILADVNGDQWLTPLDVLVIINWINRGSDAGFNGEAEMTTTAPLQSSFAFATERVGTNLTSEQTKSLDDSFASLSIDWDLGNEDLRTVLQRQPFSKPVTRSTGARFRLAPHG